MTQNSFGNIYEGVACSTSYSSRNEAELRHRQKNGFRLKRYAFVAYIDRFSIQTKHNFPNCPTLNERNNFTIEWKR
ncbi:CLUMA_CG002747, isoform A [Clunio marinus]|uniref:CLUMA_CG002747, isoform A n=1 Tax=Clunio marinus TaxID=568069 RepID=A0A1J1HMG4_9DIPT|nr:CLUMA_CG002747, isoform A [Clunio marinus]